MSFSAKIMSLRDTRTTEATYAAELAPFRSEKKQQHGWGNRNMRNGETPREIESGQEPVDGQAAGAGIEIGDEIGRQGA